MNRPSRCSRALVLLVVALLLPALAVDPSLAARSQRPTPSQSADRQRMLPASSVPELLRGTPTLTPTTRATAPVTGAMQAVQSVYLPFIARGAGRRPLEAGTARYVRFDWQELGSETLVGETEPVTVSKAYARGYNAFAGQPSNLNTIILAFGRQLEPGRVLGDGTVLADEWHVLLTRRDDTETLAQRAKNRAWIVETAGFFIEGYVQNPDHPYARIAIGTSNANYSWDCGNEGAGSIDEEDHWQAAGEEWREVVHEIDNNLSGEARNRVTIVGANDIESWFGEGVLLETEDGNGSPLDPPEQAWIGCAEGTLRWFDGWEAASNPDTPPWVINFGSNVWSEVYGVEAGEVVRGVYARFDFGDQWTLDDMLEVVGRQPDYRRYYIRVYPQIYCPGHENSWVEFVEWTVGNRLITNIYCDGVTSENNGSEFCDPAEGLTWDQSWTMLNNALLDSDVISGAVSSPLRKSVTSFYHSQLGIDEP